MGTLYTIKEVAAKLKVSEAAVRRWVLEKRIGYQKVGRLLRFTEKNIEDFIARSQ